MEGQVNDFQLLVSRLPEDMRAEFRAWVDEASETSDIDDSFLGFIADYVDLAAILERHTIRLVPDAERCLCIPSRTWTVYDVGCASGFQHVLFPFADRYVGIDAWGKQKAFLPNCEFVRGRFAEVADSLRVDRDRSFGIANMSLAYTGRDDDLEAFDRVFKHKYII